MHINAVKRFIGFQFQIDNRIILITLTDGNALFNANTSLNLTSFVALAMMVNNVAPSVTDTGETSFQLAVEYRLYCDSTQSYQIVTCNARAQSLKSPDHGLTGWVKSLDMQIPWPKSGWRLRSGFHQITRSAISGPTAGYPELRPVGVAGYWLCWVFMSRFLLL